MPEAASRVHWSQRLFDILLANDVMFFPYVPDAGNLRLLQLAEAHERTQPLLLTTEEEGVAFCAGADLAGKRSALVLQSSGVGNCVNFFTLAKGCRFPLLLIISMRGEYGEQNPWQYPSGQAVVPILDAMGLIHFRVGSEDELERAAGAAIAAAFKSGQGGALILSQQFLGAKNI